MLCVRSLLYCALALVAVGVSPAVAGPPADLTVDLDQAKLLKLPDRVATIVIGNPLIADASLQIGGVMVITGKGYGMTNVIALDRAGNVLMEKRVEVRGPIGVVVMYRGIERETYSCTPKCERQITPGDGVTFFETVIKQTEDRNDKAGGKASPTK